MEISHSLQIIWEALSCAPTTRHLVLKTISAKIFCNTHAAFQNWLTSTDQGGGGLQFKLAEAPVQSYAQCHEHLISVWRQALSVVTDANRRNICKQGRLEVLSAYQLFTRTFHHRVTRGQRSWLLHSSAHSCRFRDPIDYTRHLAANLDELGIKTFLKVLLGMVG